LKGLDAQLPVKKVACTCLLYLELRNVSSENNHRITNESEKTDVEG
jgi:hypothetical protein